jgi:hypothetical protein
LGNAVTSLRSLTLPARHIGSLPRPAHIPRLEFVGIPWRRSTQSGAQRTGSGAAVTEAVRSVVRFVQNSGPNSCPPIEWGRRGWWLISDCRFQISDWPAALGGEFLLWYNRGWIGKFFGNLVESNVLGEAGLRPRTSNVQLRTSNVERKEQGTRKRQGTVKRAGGSWASPSNVERPTSNGQRRTEGRTKGAVNPALVKRRRFTGSWGTSLDFVEIAPVKGSVRLRIAD